MEKYPVGPPRCQLSEFVWRHSYLYAGGAGVAAKPHSNSAETRNGILHRELACKAIRSALMPVAFGLSGVLWLQLFLHAYDVDCQTVLRIGWRRYRRSQEF
jgi:hypothetical protein